MAQRPSPFVPLLGPGLRRGGYREGLRGNAWDAGLARRHLAPTVARPDMATVANAIAPDRLIPRAIFPLRRTASTTQDMWQLYQFPLCPFSRKVRLLLGEKGIGYELVRESPWERRDEFLDMNPAGQVPVLADQSRGILLMDSMAICEYLEETVEKSAMINGTATSRAEIRRLVAWFDTQFFADIVAPLLHERMEKRLVTKEPPDSKRLRDAMKAAVRHLDYTDYLLDHHNWMAGATMSLADLAAAAQISVADYLGGIDWKNHEQTAKWYRGFKSRPSFRPLLSERMEGIMAPKHYDDVDF